MLDGSRIVNYLRSAISRYATALRSVVSKSLHLVRTDAPRGVFLAYYAGLLDGGGLRKKYRTQLENFDAAKRDLQVSNDWFSGHAPRWLAMMDAHGLRRSDVKALEIGSWEGLSSSFILSELPRAHLTCVDTWEGGDEHKDGTASSLAALSQVESAFDANLSPFASRLTKFKGTSYAFFNDHDLHDHFDFIYVDGSHRSADVIIDAVKSFEALKVGGVMVFDDYFWDYYPRATDNPAAAINLFLRLKKGAYEIIQVHDQVAVLKTAG